MNGSLASIPWVGGALFSTNGPLNAASEAVSAPPRCPEQDLDGALAGAAISALNPSQSQETSPEMPTRVGQPLRILVVDDEPLVREVVRLFLEEDQHSITMASNGRDGLARFCEGEFDLVLTDRAMPEMNGNQLARAIKTLKPTQPIILLTGFDGGLKENPAVDLVVAKPFTMASLRRAIREVLGGA